jgi:hypothetical protein
MHACLSIRANRSAEHVNIIYNKEPNNNVHEKMTIGNHQRSPREEVDNVERGILVCVYCHIIFHATTAVCLYVCMYIYIERDDSELQKDCKSEEIMAFFKMLLPPSETNTIQ